MRYSKYSVIIVGSGMSGLYLANKLCENSKFSDGILLITKEKLFSGSSSLAQGGIVSVIPEINPADSIESHIKDTLVAGCGVNDISAVQLVSQESSNIAQELIRFGVEFDLNDKKMLNFTLEGAHSCPRILHAKGDSTGRIIEEALVKRLSTFSNIDIYENTMAVELLVNQENVCNGLISYNYINQEFEAIYSNCVVLATGGIGQIYQSTTNPVVSTADGISLAYCAGAEVENMHFVQFHPTALYVENKKTTPLISESVRGEGAKLVNQNGEYFAKNYHAQADLAPRDVVSRAIISELEKTNTEYVNLDISQMGIENFKKRFPTITGLCEENNIDLSQGMIPVCPAEHYFMGGIKTDLNARTSIENLYAIGECASTGLHGANRLASNSLLECGVFAEVLAKNILMSQKTPPKKYDENVKRLVEQYIDSDSFSENDNVIMDELFETLKKTMTKYVGIIRDEKGLFKALDVISDINSKMSSLSINNSRTKFELQNALIVSSLIVKDALRADESVGAHFRSDCEIKEIKNENIGRNDEKLLFK